MPIRSDRGRNATLRTLATWPLHSPRRLAGTIAALTVLCAGSTFALTANTTSHSATPVTAFPSHTLTLSAPALARTRPVWTTTGLPIPLGDPAAAGRRFAEAWVAKLDPPIWRERLAPLCTDEFRATVLPATSPGQITATGIIGDVTLTASTGRGAELIVPLDTMVLALILHDITGNGDWRVADARPGR